MATWRAGGRAIASLVVLTLLATGAAAAVPETTLRSEYDFHLQLIQRTVNYDGGWGEPHFVDVDNNTTVTRTEPSAASLRETVVSALALHDAGVDPLSHWTNTADKRDVSLAASDVPNTLDWLRTYEANPAENLTAGDRSLIALAYAGLGDSGNARRIADQLLATYRKTGGWGDLTSVAQSLWVLHELDLPANATVNETVTSALSHLVFADPDRLTIEELAWGYRALDAYNLEESEEYRAVIGTRWDPIAGYASRTRTSLLAWTLASNPREHEAALEAVEWVFEKGRDWLGREGRAYYILAESALHPYFTLFPVPTSDAGSSLPVGGIRTRDQFAAPGEIDRLLAENRALKERVDDLEGRALPFPLPAWVIGAILLSAIAVLVVVKLAWGLKRENLSGARKDIFDYIERTPGEHLNKIRRELGMAPGTIMYHLGNLETEGWITSHKDTRYKRYYVNGNKLTQLLPGGEYKEKFAILANDTSKQIARFVREHPGSTQKLVSTRLDLHPSTVNWHAKRLKQVGLLADQRVGKEVRYQIADQKFVDQVLDQAFGGSPEEPSPPAEPPGAAS